MHKIYHTIIVGAGPAGLAAASALSAHGVHNYLLIERGKSLKDRRHDKEEDIPSGVGGAGLYSDGKFSFYPSATWLWQNVSAEPLKKSYQWLQHCLQQYNVSPPNFEDRASHSSVTDKNFKAYDSFYINFMHRYAMIDEWSKSFTTNTLTETSVINISKINDYYLVETNRGVYYTTHIVIATGRMGSLQLDQFTLPIEQAFQRIEVGVRIKGPHDHPFFKELQQHGKFLDPKFIFSHPDHPLVSWRTFCFCKRGEIMNSGSDGYVTLSGRADCPPTEESNIGYNTRIKIPALSPKLPKLDKPFTLSLAEVLSEKTALYSYFDSKIADYVALGLLQLKNHFPSLSANENIDIVGPTIEGVGNYPVVDQQLEASHKGLYVVGDSLGLFRGLTAALLSGHYIGQSIANVVNQSQQSYVVNL